jgi:LPXTG-motif cell wall-anchored protein
VKHLIWFLATLVFALAAWAHGGEDHGDGAAPAMAADIAPRAVAQSEDFELVAVLAQGRLTLYLDRYADNAPVTDAEIEVESGAFKAAAQQVAPGVYAVPGEAFARAGKYPLTFSVQAGERADLLTASLDLSDPAIGVAHAHDRTEWAIWIVAGVLLLAGAALLVLRRRKHRKH